VLIVCAFAELMAIVNGLACVIDDKSSVLELVMVVVLARSSSGIFEPGFV